MVIPSVGAIVLVSFPFSDLSRSKLRPAVVLADTGRHDWVLCQVTSQPYSDPQAVEITSKDFVSGSLKKTSYVRPGKLFTANTGIMTRQIGEVRSEKLKQVVRAIVAMLENSVA